MDNPHFQIGDIVTRDGTDRHVVEGTNADVSSPPDMIKVRCVRVPRTGWCKVGDVDDNLARRYEYAETIDGELAALVKQIA